MSDRFHDAGLTRGRPSVLGNSPRLTQNSYREAVRATVMALGASEALTDQDMADVLSTSAATVGNARNKKGDLSAIPLLSIGKAFGPASLGTVMALIGAKAVPVEAVCVGDVSRIPVEIAKVLPMLMELLADGACCAGDIDKLDRAGAIDVIGSLADMLREKRNNARLRAVNN